MKNSFSVNALSKFGIDTEGLDKEAQVERKRFSSKISMNPDEDMTCVATISTSDEDSDGEVILPKGCELKRFMSNPVVMYAHDYSSKPVAKVVALSVTDDAIVAKMKFAETQEAKDIWSLVKGGFLSACSIGFITKEYFNKGTDEFKACARENKLKVKDTCRRIISKFELIENSIVPIPANPEALMQAISAKSISISDKLVKDLGLKDEHKEETFIELAKLVAKELKELQAKEVKEVEVLEKPVEVVEVAPVVEQPKPEPKPVHFAIVDEAIELTQEEKNELIQQMRSDRAKMLSGKLI